MELDPRAKALLTAFAVAGIPSIKNIPVEHAREMVENGMARMKSPVARVGAVHNITLDGPAGKLPARIYVPEGRGPFPVVIFFHGGGWVFFDLDAYDSICTHLCKSAQSLIISLGYRRSPEYKFPAAIDDCLVASRWIADHCNKWNGDPEHIFLAGDSAGGNLAAVTAIRIRDEGGPSIRGQVLIYPVTDHYDREKASAREFADGFNLSQEDLHWFWDQYLEDPADGLNPLASPLLARDLSGLPPALVLVAGYDPLHDDGIEYARRLTAEGVEVKLLNYGDMIHGFISYLGIFRQGKEAIDEIASWIHQSPDAVKL